VLPWVLQVLEGHVVVGDIQLEAEPNADKDAMTAAQKSAHTHAVKAEAFKSWQTCQS